jgi:hypothetical protein
VQLGREPVDLAGQFRVRLELQLPAPEVMIRFGLLECRLLVLPDHDKRGQEDRFQRHDQRERRSQLGLDEQYPDGEHHNVKVDKPHRPGVCGAPTASCGGPR